MNLPAVLRKSYLYLSTYCNKTTINKTRIDICDADFVDSDVVCISVVTKAGSGRMSPVRARTMKEYDQVSSSVTKSKPTP